MSVGTQSITIRVNPDEKTMFAWVDVFFRKLLTVTVTGADNDSAQLVLLAYRGDTLVATAEGFSGTDTNAVSTMDLNTTELLTVMTGVKYGNIKTLSIYLWNIITLELVAIGTLNVRGDGTYSDVGTSPTSPISTTTKFWGRFALYEGLTYVKSVTDGLYYPFSLAGTGDTVHEYIDETGGITIPGG